MANQDQIDMMMRNFPPEAEILQMPPDDLGMHLLKYMTRGRAETNRFNFLQVVAGGQVAFRFMEAWNWLTREGFLALAPTDMYGQNHFVTRAGEAAAQLDDLDTWCKANLFPDHFDAALVRYVKPLFSRGDLRHGGLPRVQGGRDPRAQEERLQVGVRTRPDAEGVRRNRAPDGRRRGGTEGCANCSPEQSPSARIRVRTRRSISRIGARSST